MRLDFNTTHYVLRVEDDVVTVHMVVSYGQVASMYSTHTSITNALEDLFQRTSRHGGRWGAVYERTSTDGAWISVVRESKGAPEYTGEGLIAEGTPVAIYYDLMPHLHMMRGQ